MAISARNFRVLELGSYGPWLKDGSSSGMIPPQVS